MVNHGKLSNEQYSISIEFSHSEVFQLYLPINAIFPMLGAVYLQTPDKRLLEIQYFFYFKLRVPMFEDPGAPYS